MKHTGLKIRPRRANRPSTWISLERLAPARSARRRKATWPATSSLHAQVSARQETMQRHARISSFRTMEYRPKRRHERKGSVIPSDLPLRWCRAGCDL